MEDMAGPAVDTCAFRGNSRRNSRESSPISSPLPGLRSGGLSVSGRTALVGVAAPNPGLLDEGHCCSPAGDPGDQQVDLTEQPKRQRKSCRTPKPKISAEMVCWEGITGVLEEGLVPGDRVPRRPDSGTCCIGSNAVPTQSCCGTLDATRGGGAVSGSTGSVLGSTTPNPDETVEEPCGTVGSAARTGVQKESPTTVTSMLAEECYGTSCTAEGTQVLDGGATNGCSAGSASESATGPGGAIEQLGKGAPAYPPETLVRACGTTSTRETEAGTACMDCTGPSQHVHGTCETLPDACGTASDRPQATLSGGEASNDPQGMDIDAPTGASGEGPSDGPPGTGSGVAGMETSGPGFASAARRHGVEVRGGVDGSCSEGARVVETPELSAEARGAAEVERVMAVAHLLSPMAEVPGSTPAHAQRCLCVLLFPHSILYEGPRKEEVKEGWGRGMTSARPEMSCEYV